MHRTGGSADRLEKEGGAGGSGGRVRVLAGAPYPPALPVDPVNSVSCQAPCRGRHARVTVPGIGSRCIPEALPIRTSFWDRGCWCHGRGRSRHAGDWP